jgi:hypothetical protein
MDKNGEFIYKYISLSGSSDSKNNNWATTSPAVASFTSSPKNIILSFKSLEYMS